MWLLLRGAIDAESVEPDQMLIGTIDVAAAMMDDAGPDGVVEFFGADVDQTVDVLDHLWRAEHERTVEVLDALGSHHPDRQIAKAARRSLMKARSRG
jgi:phage-related baseplate assembly protein